MTSSPRNLKRDDSLQLEEDRKEKSAHTSPIIYENLSLQEKIDLCQSVAKRLENGQNKMTENAWKECGNVIMEYIKLLDNNLIPTSKFKMTTRQEKFDEMVKVLQLVLKAGEEWPQNKVGQMMIKLQIGLKLTHLENIKADYERGALLLFECYYFIRGNEGGESTGLFALSRIINPWRTLGRYNDIFRLHTEMLEFLYENQRYFKQFKKDVPKKVEQTIHALVQMSLLFYFKGKMVRPKELDPKKLQSYSSGENELHITHVCQDLNVKDCPHHCSYCFKFSEISLASCGICLKSFYCNQDCQKRAWRYHKLNECKDSTPKKKVERALLLRTFYEIFDQI